MARRPGPRRRSFTGARASAQNRLRRFRQGSLLAIAMTGMILLLFGIEDVPAQQETPPDAAVGAADAPVQPADTGSDAADPGIALEEATGTLRELAQDFTAILPKIIIAILLLVLAAILVRLLRAAVGRTGDRWERAAAVSALGGAIIWLTALGVALAVIAGDARALLGSVGLLGLALSWALQAPIESFAGWLLNSFKGYYRIGDRIEVGEVFGDVYRIDALTTTVWEAGGPGKPVHGAQPTGALITFPNSEVLRANVINHTRGFPYVWDEVTIGIANDSDIRYAMDVIHGVAERVVGEAMREPVTRYRGLLERENLAYDVADGPQVYLAPTEAWLDVTVRYLVPARERRKWSSLLYEETLVELSSAEHRSRVREAYPVTRVELKNRGDA